jgi:hypothetical protein
MNLRELVGIDEPYFQFDREERQMAAILFHLLNHNDNAGRVIRSVEPDWKINPTEFGIYFEYSYPRDLWDRMEVKASSNAHKREVIMAILGKQGFDVSKLATLATNEDFNGFFIQKPSSGYIQSPANWNLLQIADNLPSPDSNNDLLIACKVKWAFKAKPDIVIHADREHALCIELKLESSEGSYPSEGDEKKLLRVRGLFGEGKRFMLPMSQTKLQRFLMVDLLGLTCRFRFVSRQGKPGSEYVSWNDFLEPLKPLPSLPPYIIAALNKVAPLKVGVPPLAA